MTRRIGWWLAVGTAMAVSVGARRAAAQAQPSAVTRAVELEQAGRWRDAIAAWRQVIDGGDAGQGMLGLERVFSQLGQEDSVLAAVTAVLPAQPANRIVRGVQLRMLRAAGRDADARAAFEAWVTAVPHDAAPYKEYAVQLISDTRAAAADSVLQRGAAALGSSREFLIEIAQLQVALGQWGRGAAAWRRVMVAEPYMEQSALFSLGAVPASERDSVRVALAGTLKVPADAGTRKVHGMLELQWGNPREGWRILSTLTVADSAYDTWSDFAGDAERMQAWLPARDALMAMHAARPAVAILLRAATAAVSGGDPASALPILSAARAKVDAPMLRGQVLPLEVRALTSMGRAADAEALVARDGMQADATTKRIFAGQIAWGWVRAGDVEKARRALAGASADDDEEVRGWIALFEGDLKAARAGLRRPADATPDVVTAMAMLGRTKADTARAAGAAFLALARGDTAGAAQRFERAADELVDVAPLLLGYAARLWSLRRNDAQAIAAWSRVVQRFPQSPEAAESDLEWARTLRRRGDASGAGERLEHLILTYPNSALVPQARRELENLRSGVA
jgi:tetratricopeptide (TPR) repeat protein